MASLTSSDVAEVGIWLIGLGQPGYDGGISRVDRSRLVRAHKPPFPSRLTAILDPKKLSAGRASGPEAAFRWFLVRLGTVFARTLPGLTNKGNLTLWPRIENPEGPAERRGVQNDLPDRPAMFPEKEHVRRFPAPVKAITPPQKEGARSAAVRKRQTPANTGEGHPVPKTTSLGPSRASPGDSGLVQLMEPGARAESKLRARMGLGTEKPGQADRRIHEAVVTQIERGAPTGRHSMDVVALMGSPNAQGGRSRGRPAPVLRAVLSGPRVPRGANPGLFTRAARPGNTM